MAERGNEDWMKPAGIAAVVIGGLAFFASAAVGGGIVAGLLNPLFFIGVPLGLHWLNRCGAFDMPTNQPTTQNRPTENKSNETRQQEPTVRDARNEDIIDAEFEVIRETQPVPLSPSDVPNETVTWKAETGLSIQRMTSVRQRAFRGRFLVGVLVGCALGIGIGIGILSRSAIQKESASRDVQSEGNPINSGVKKGSFRVWTFPDSPSPMKPYFVTIEVTLPKEYAGAYSVRDLEGKIQGNEAESYAQRIPWDDRLARLGGQEYGQHTFAWNPQRQRWIWLDPEANGLLPVIDGKALLRIKVPGAEIERIKDTINIRSKLLQEQQTLEIVFASASGHSKVQVDAISDDVRTVVYLVDRSGSMIHNEALLFAKKYLIASLNGLSPKHRFQIIFYNESAHVLPIGDGSPHGPVLATSRNIEKAKLRVAAVRPQGGTDIKAALRTAFRNRPDAIFFLTDGDGKFDWREAIELRRLNSANTRIHCIELGVGVRRQNEDNALVRLARLTGGKYAYRILPVVPGQPYRH